MLEQIDLIKQQLQKEKPASEEELEKFRLKFLAKKGEITQLFDKFTTVPAEEKKTLGKELNTLKQEAQKIYETYKGQLKLLSKQKKIQQEDYTLPPPEDTLGSFHPITILKLKILSFFEKMGFAIVDGPEIEDDWHNFSALNFRTNHPARDMVDTFFITQNPPTMLRTHTTSVQVRIAENQQPPIRAISLGKVYRNETISARSHCMFHQVDGFYINEQVTFQNLKQLLASFMHTLFGPHANIRLRPAYFPFTVLSSEIDVDCTMCKGKGCNICKYTGWLEIMGAGMIDPQVLQNSHIDPDRYTGYAFGMGLERVAMLLYGIDDLRLFTQNDSRFLKQFKVFP